MKFSSSRCEENLRGSARPRPLFEFLKECWNAGDKSRGSGEIYRVDIEGPRQITAGVGLTVIPAAWRKFRDDWRMAER